MGAQRSESQASQKRGRGGSASEIPESPLPSSPKSLSRQAKLLKLLKQLKSQAPGADAEDSKGILQAAAAAGAGDLGPLGDGTASLGLISVRSSTSSAAQAPEVHRGVRGKRGRAFIAGTSGGGTSRYAASIVAAPSSAGTTGGSSSNDTRPPALNVCVELPASFEVVTGRGRGRGRGGDRGGRGDTVGDTTTSVGAYSNNAVAGTTNSGGSGAPSTSQPNFRGGKGKGKGKVTSSDAGSSSAPSLGAVHSMISTNHFNVGFSFSVPDFLLSSPLAFLCTSNDAQARLAACSRAISSRLTHRRRLCTLSVRYLGASRIWLDRCSCGLHRAGSGSCASRNSNRSRKRASTGVPLACP